MSGLIIMSGVFMVLQRWGNYLACFRLFLMFRTSFSQWPLHFPSHNFPPCNGQPYRATTSTSLERRQWRPTNRPIKPFGMESRYQFTDGELDVKTSQRQQTSSGWLNPRIFCGWDVVEYVKLYEGFPQAWSRASTHLRELFSHCD